jgi:hypothetical protein
MNKGLALDLSGPGFDLRQKGVERKVVRGGEAELGAFLDGDAVQGLIFQWPSRLEVLEQRS